MGAKCCMPVRDDVPMILRKEYGGPNEIYSRRSSRCSPSWGFRCDNRTHIEDIEVDHAWASGGHGSTTVSEFKNGGDIETEGHSDGSSSSGSFRTPNWQKFQNEMSIPGNSQSNPTDFSTSSDSSPEETEITELPSTTPPNPKLSSISPDQQICGLCSKTLVEPTTIVAVLSCGHVYHADCLENVTPGASKFDPACPTCSLGESSKGKAPLKPCPKTKILSQPFLKRHFSVGSRSVKLPSERECSKKKGLWARYR